MRFARLVSFLLLVVLAVAGIALAVFSIDTGKSGLSLGWLASNLHFPAVRHAVGDWLGRLETGSNVAITAALCGIGAILLGVLLLAGLLGPRRERLLELNSGDRGRDRRASAHHEASSLKSARSPRGSLPSGEGLRSRSAGFCYPLLDHLRKILGGPIVWAPGVNGGVVLSLRGGDFLFESGQDLAVGYERHDSDTVHLYLQESFSFVIATREAAVSLRPPGT